MGGSHATEVQPEDSDPPGRVIGAGPGIIGAVDETATGLLSVTEKAAAKARALAERDGLAGACLRVRVVAGGCSGFTYRLSFEPEPGPDDHVVEEHGLRVLVDPRSAPILEGSTLDFSDALLGGGFRVRNPRAVHECACGESFAL
jgi:iron-sulfur cluster assembly protein